MFLTIVMDKKLNTWIFTNIVILITSLRLNQTQFNLSNLSAFFLRAQHFH